MDEDLGRIGPMHGKQSSFVSPPACRAAADTTPAPSRKALSDVSWEPSHENSIKHARTAIHVKSSMSLPWKLGPSYPLNFLHEKITETVKLSDIGHTGASTAGQEEATMEREPIRWGPDGMPMAGGNSLFLTPVM
jgi:hypothetical protein